MLGGADNTNGELPSYITGANIAGSLRIRCGHRHPAGLTKPFVLCHKTLLLSFDCLPNIQNECVTFSVSDQ